MDNIGFAVKDQFYVTGVRILELIKKIPPISAVIALVILYIFCFRHWELRKVGSLFLTLSLLLICHVRLELFFLSALSAEGATMAVSILQIVSGILGFAIFLYHAAVSQ